MQLHRHVNNLILYTMVPFIVSKNDIFVTKSFIVHMRFHTVPVGDGQTAVGLV